MRIAVVLPTRRRAFNYVIHKLESEQTEVRTIMQNSYLRTEHDSFFLIGYTDVIRLRGLRVDIAIVHKDIDHDILSTLIYPIVGYKGRVFIAEEQYQ